MKWRGRRKSSNVRRDTSPNYRSGPRPSYGGRRRRSTGPRFIPIGGVGGLIILLLYVLLSGSLGTSNQPAQQQQTRPPYRQQQEQSADSIDYQNDLEEFLAVVLADTEDVWHQVFDEAGFEYEEPMLVLYQGSTHTACGIGDSRMGPFYCPADQSVYIDPEFYYELRDQFDSPGDFAFAYVLAHEVGHHVQNLLGITDEVFRQQARMSERAFNTKYLVRLELQADYLAGVFAHYVQDKGYLEQGDIEEAMRAAAAVGDDTIQKKMTGHVIPDKFTHGTSEQRMRWFNKGFKYGDLEHMDTFGVKDKDLSYREAFKLQKVPALPLP